MNKIEVLLPLPFNGTFTYQASGNLAIGQVVTIPFRSVQKVGVVWHNKPQNNTRTLKTITECKEGFCLKPELLSFIDRVAAYNIIPKGMVLKMVLSAREVFFKELKEVEPQLVNNAELATLTAEQKKASGEIIAKLKSGHSVTVLDGITGSGKTEVYLDAIYETIKQGRQALVLLPEIVLTSQLIERFEVRFGFRPLEWHSALTPKFRRQGWFDVYKNRAKFVVGARSALFLPFDNLGLIIVDEEHDQSFKQEESQIYNARDMAVLRASIEGVPVILSSATPSVETVYNSISGKYQSLHLTSRYGEGILPEVQIIDLGKQLMPKGQWLSPPLKEELGKNLQAHRQSMLFLNRRGYSPITLCGNCLHKLACPNCNFFLVEHRGQNILQCHYCGHKEAASKVCPNCGSIDKMYAVGPGVERLEEEVKRAFPDVRTVVLTSDTVTNRKLVQGILQSITDHKVDIIIGTQMVTKGLHFPKLDLVGVVDADSSMMCGDIRALERTYQLLYQVSGRAGRESDRGKVMLQTYDPDNIVLQNLISGNRSAFISAELADREAANMPPYTRIILITLTSHNELRNLQVARDLSKAAPDLDEVRVLGPSPAPLFLLRRQYRHRFVIIAQRSVNIQKIIEQWLGSIPIARDVKIKIDVDPYSFS